MRLNRRIRIQLAIFAVVALAVSIIIAVQYIQLPAMLFGAGRYTVTVELPETAGLYPSSNVTYLGTEVGRVTAVQLTDSGVKATLSMKAGIDIPSDLDAQVHSQSAVGEQFVELLPRKASPPLKNNDVIPVDRTTVPADINNLLDQTNRGLEAIPQDNLKTVIDESYAAVRGLGPEISRIVKGSTQLAIDAQANIAPITTVLDQSQPVLDSQTHTADSIRSWARHLADITGQLKRENASVAGLLEHGPEATGETRKFLDRLQPSVPMLMANLVSLNKIALVYQPAIEQLLVLLPVGVANLQATSVMNWYNASPYAGLMMDFKMNVNLAHPCETGFLPAQQMRSPALTDTPERPAGLYCRIPQNSSQDVRGARNLPCMTVPGKRAPTVNMCESKEHYVPLNDGNSWKGDPNATLSGQDIPQRPPGAAAPAPPAAAPPPIAAAPYDPATGTYLGPDGRTYTQSDLGTTSKGPQTWQKMLTPAGK